MSREPNYLTDFDRAWARLDRYKDQAQIAAIRMGYELGREDERKAVPRGTRPFDVKAKASARALITQEGSDGVRS